MGGDRLVKVLSSGRPETNSFLPSFFPPILRPLRNFCSENNVFTTTADQTDYCIRFFLRQTFALFTHFSSLSSFSSSLFAL